MSLQLLQTSEQGGPALVIIPYHHPETVAGDGATLRKAQEIQKKTQPTQRTTRPLKGLKITEKKVQGSEGTALKSCSS